MAGRSWLVDPSRIATKIRTASGSFDPEKVSWKSNPTKSCPNCQYVIDNSDVAHEWPGLPRGVKFDPSDQEIIWHLLTKVGVENSKAHPFIDEFIPTVEEDGGICYTHPQNLPGVKQDGSVSHFFHRAIKAYNTGTRKRRKINGDDSGDVRWHKTGRTKPVLIDGVQKGCKKIMVLYVSPARGGKAEKTNWVMHQYHLGTTEDEREGEYVVSKVFHQQQQQQQQVKASEKTEEDADITTTKVDVVTPEPPRADTRMSNYELEQTPEVPMVQASASENPINDMEHEKENQPLQNGEDDDHIITETHNSQMEGYNPNEGQWWEDESQFLLSSQQLVEGLSLCDELLQSQSPNREENNANGRGVDSNDRNNNNGNNKPRLSDYASLGPEDLKRDLLECQNMATDPANIELDTPPDFRLSQLEFESQDSFIAWGGSVKRQDH